MSRGCKPFHSPAERPRGIEPPLRGWQPRAGTARTVASPRRPLHALRQGGGVAGGAGEGSRTLLSLITKQVPVHTGDTSMRHFAMTEGIEPSSVGLTGLCSATELRHHLLRGRLLRPIPPRGRGDTSTFAVLLDSRVRHPPFNRKSRDRAIPHAFCQIDILWPQHLLLCNPSTLPRATGVRSHCKS